MWWALLSGLVTAGANAGLSAAANAGSGNAERIKELKSSRARGDLVTEEGRALAEAGLSEQRKGLTSIMEQQQRMNAMQGATSGAAMVGTQQASQQAFSDLSERTAEKLQAAAAKEEKELQDRLALRRERTIGAISSSAKSGVSAASAVASADAATSDKTKEDKTPDFSAIEDEGVRTATEAAWQQQYQRFESGEINQKEWNQFQRELKRVMETTGDYDAGMTTDDYLDTSGLGID